MPPPLRNRIIPAVLVLSTFLVLAQLETTTFISGVERNLTGIDSEFFSVVGVAHNQRQFYEKLGPAAFRFYRP